MSHKGRLQGFVDTEPVLEWIRRHSHNGVGPSRRMYDMARYGTQLPSTSKLQRHGISWRSLVIDAGVELRRGNIPPEVDDGIEEEPAPRQRRRTFADIGQEIDEMAATAEPVRPKNWPLFGIPTKTERKEFLLPDGSVYRVTRQFYSLR